MCSVEQSIGDVEGRRKLELGDDDGGNKKSSASIFADFRGIGFRLKWPHYDYSSKHSVLKTEVSSMFWTLTYASCK